MRRFFQSRSGREQTLLAAFVMMAAVVWMFGAASRVRSRWADWRSVQAGLAAQQVWIDRRAEVEAQAAAAVRNLEPARTHDATRLVTAVTSLASQAGLQPAIETPQTKRTQQFAHHTIRVTFRRAQLGPMLAFYDELSRTAPYLSLEQVSMQTDRGGGGTLTATLQISSTQISR